MTGQPRKSPRKFRSAFWIGGVLALASAGGVYWKLHQTAKSPVQTASASKDANRAPVRVAMVKRLDFPIMLTGLGTVQASTDGWHIAQTDHDKGDETRFHEDKFAVLFAPSSLPLIGAAIHLTAAPAAAKAASGTGRGLHYTAGFIADVWQWRASHQGFDGHIDNCHFGSAVEPTADQLNGRARYAGGFAIDPGPAAYRANIQGDPAKTSGDRVTPWRLPRDMSLTARALGRLSDTPAQSESEGARWRMSESESVPYSATADSALPAGTVVPGIVMHDAVPVDRNSVRLPWRFCYNSM